MDFSFTRSQEALRERVDVFCRQALHRVMRMPRSWTAAPHSLQAELHAALAASGLLGHCFGFGGVRGRRRMRAGRSLHPRRGPRPLQQRGDDVFFINSVSAVDAHPGRNGGAEGGPRHQGRPRHVPLRVRTHGARCWVRRLRAVDTRRASGRRLHHRRRRSSSRQGAREADIILTVARTRAEGKASQGTSLLLVPSGSPGLTITPLDKIAGNAISSCRVEYRAVRVPCSNLVGGEHQAWGTLSLGGALERLDGRGVIARGRTRSVRRDPSPRTSRRASSSGSPSVAFRRCSTNWPTWPRGSRPHAGSRTTRPGWWPKARCPLKRAAWPRCPRSSDSPTRSLWECACSEAGPTWKDVAMERRAARVDAEPVRRRTDA